jgi:phosphatidylglycerophosphate synthase
MWTVLWLATGGLRLSPAPLAALFAVLLHLYLVYDHVDGMHAKRTGTSSALGEYLDHSLDVYHGAISVLAVFALLGFDRPLPVLIMLWCTLVAFAATMVEEKERGELRFGALGSLEGVLLLIAFFGSWTVPAGRAWWLTPFLAGLPAYWLLIGGFGLGALLTAGECLWRVGRAPKQFLWFSLASLALALWQGLGVLPFWRAVATLLLFCGDYVGRVIGSHLLNRPHPWPDRVAIGAILLGCADALGPRWIEGTMAWYRDSLSIYLGIRTLCGIAGVLWLLRHDWLWVNPAQDRPEVAGRGHARSNEITPSTSRSRTR